MEGPDCLLRGIASSYLQLLGTVLAERSLIAATALSSEGRNGPLIIRLRRGPITCFPDGTVRAWLIDVLPAAENKAVTVG